MPREGGLRAARGAGPSERDEDLDDDRTRQRRLSGDANHCVFSSRRVVPEAEVYTARNRAVLRARARLGQLPVGAADRHRARRRPRSGFVQGVPRRCRVAATVYGRTVGPISSLGREAIEYYCWGAFGTTAAETSAYHGLNFFAAEFGDILVFPGGNAFIAQAPRRAHRARQPERDSHERVDAARRARGQRVARDDLGVGALRRYRARSVVFASPLFLAPKIMPSLPDAQQQAIATLDYRGYIVANVLLGRSANAHLQVARPSVTATR